MMIYVGLSKRRRLNAAPGGPEANICGGCPYDANPQSNDRACRSCAFNPTVDDADRGPLSGTMNLAKSMATSAT